MCVCFYLYFKKNLMAPNTNYHIRARMRIWGGGNRLMHLGLIDRVWSLGLSNLSCSNWIGGRWGSFFYYLCNILYIIIYTYKRRRHSLRLDAPTHDDDDDKNKKKPVIGSSPSMSPTER